MSEPQPRSAVPTTEEWSEPGRTATRAEGDETEQFPWEEPRTQSKAEGDRETIEESLRQKGLA